MFIPYVPYLAALTLVILGAILLIEKFVLLPRREATWAKTGDPGKSPGYVDSAKSLFPILAVIIAVESFLVQPFQIPSESMVPTLEVGDFILVNKLSYGVRLPLIHTKIAPVADPERGDVIVFRYPSDPSIDFVKRVIGIPGDRILYTMDKQLFVNGYLVAKAFVSKDTTHAKEANLYKEQLGAAEHMIRLEMETYHATPASEWTVPAGNYFVMGDNRDNSHDSRFWDDQNIPKGFQGMVPDENLVGKAFIIALSWPEPRYSHFPNIWRTGLIR